MNWVMNWDKDTIEHLHAVLLKRVLDERQAYTLPTAEQIPIVGQIATDLSETTDQDTPPQSRDNSPKP